MQNIEYTKVSKAKARNWFLNGHVVFVKAKNLRMAYLIGIDPDWYNDFESAINSYKYYNCNTECGNTVEYFISSVSLSWLLYRNHI